MAAKKGYRETYQMYQKVLKFDGLHLCCSIPEVTGPVEIVGLQLPPSLLIVPVG